MNLRSLFSRGPKWRNLSRAERCAVARNLGAQAVSMAYFGRGYEAVTSPFSEQRRPSVVETRGEDLVLSARDRARIVNMHRDMMRNSPTRVAQDQQIRVNVVGCEGGKLYAAFPSGYGGAARAVERYFNKSWGPHAEFTFRKSFNWLLKTQLTAQDSGGNVVLVFDDGILTGGDGTGRIRGFEGDEIADVPVDLMRRHYSERHRMSQGFVYDASGVFVGCYCSTSQRGRKVFDPSLGVLRLSLDPFAEGDANWTMLGDMRRFNQGRAVSPVTAAITCLVDLHETVASEAQAAKMNAQLVGQVLKDASLDDGQDEREREGAGFDDEADGVEVAREPFTARNLNAIGARFDEMPSGRRLELLDTKRPNANMQAYTEMLAGFVGGTRGLARVFSTLRAQTSYTAFRGEQVMTEPTFRERRKETEREVCDWAARCAIRRAVRLGLVRERLPEGWEGMLAWKWPRMLEVSEKDAQTALNQKLKNGVTSLHRELGPGEYDRLREERRREAADYAADGLVYPGSESVSGALAPATEGGAKDGDGPENGEDKEERSDGTEHDEV